MIKFSGVPSGEACTIVLRGATEKVLEEADRSLHDALSVLSQTTKETRTVLGGGCSEMIMSMAVDRAAQNAEGKKALAIESLRLLFVSSPPFWLTMLVSTLVSWSQNCGLLSTTV